MREILRPESQGLGFNTAVCALLTCRAARATGVWEAVLFLLVAGCWEGAEGAEEGWSFCLSWGWISLVVGLWSPGGGWGPAAARRVARLWSCVCMYTALCSAPGSKLFK